MNAYLSWVAFHYEIPFSVLDVINLCPINNLKNLEQVCDFHNLMTPSEETKNKAELERNLNSSFPLDKHFLNLLALGKSSFTSFSLSWQDLVEHLPVGQIKDEKLLARQESLLV